jgi:hypothetical protein
MSNTDPAADPGLPSSFRADDLVRLRDELERVQAARDAFEASGSDGDDPNYDAHWDAREKIEAIPATGFAGLFVKARAAELAFRYDDDLHCDGSGSFVTLAKSIIRDLKAIEARLTACPIAPLAGEMEKIIQAHNRIDKQRPGRRDLAFDNLEDRINIVEKTTSIFHAKSARGALLQAFVLDAEIEMIASNGSEDDSPAYRQIQRFLYSVTRVLEELGGESLPACRQYYQDECFDPFLAVGRALAGEDAETLAEASQTSGDAA